MRVVLDTNVLLAAAFFPGVCEKLLAHCFLTPSIQLVLSEHILGEFVEHGLGKLTGTAKPLFVAFQPAAVPEPGSVGLAACGLATAGFGLWRRRRKAGRCGGV